nr:transcriptional regulator,tetR family [uncultured bacterium]
MNESQATLQTAGSDTATRRRNRNRILDAATELLSTGEPLTKLSIRRIAKSAGISRATFYLHFKSKHDLIAALAKRETDPWIELAAPALDAGSISRADMEQVARGAIDLYRTHRGVLAGIIELAEYDDETRQAWRETIHEFANRFQVAIQRWRLDLSEPEAKQLARMIVWGGERFLHQEVGDADAGSDQLHLWTLTELAWRLMND